MAGSPYTLQWAPLSPKIAPSHREIWTPSNLWVLGTIRNPQHKWHLYRFSHLCTDDHRVSLYFAIPQKFAPSHGGSEPPSNTWFPGPTRVLNLNGISIGSAVFAGLTSVTDWQRDRPTGHATRSVTIGRIYVLRCILIITIILHQWQYNSRAKSKS